MQTAEQYNQITALCKANDLADSDIWQHKQSGHWIVSRTGIEKIIAKNRLTFAIELAACGIEFAVVKATVSLPRKAGVMYADTPQTIESFGSAQPANVSKQFSYFAEMAEKRAKGRAVLMMMGFYALGVYGEDEAPAFSQSANVPAEVKPVLYATTVGETEPAPIQYATAAQKEKIIRLLNHSLITRPEKTKMLMNINRLDESRAAQAISKLESAISERDTHPAAAKI